MARIVQLLYCFPCTMRDSDLRKGQVMLRKIKARFLYILRTIIFSNTLGIPTNRLWRNFHKSCQSEYQGIRSSRPSKVVEELRKDRMTVLSRQSVTEIALKVDEHFAGQNATYSAMPLADAVKFADEIFKIIKSAEQDVIDYYGSYFQPYWIQIQRTTPGKTTSDTSFGWHMDDNPKEMLKLFVYLNDVNESNGAFRAFSWKHSRRILLKGFQSASSDVRMASQSIADKHLQKNPQSLKVLEGSKGTVLAFDNNLIHKGTAPRVGYRHVIQIPIYPSRIPLNVEMVRRALLSPQKRDYPLDPEINDHGF
jgi:hypothetical protein